MKTLIGFAVTLALCSASAQTTARNVPRDLSKVRGFNYQSAPTLGHAEHWLLYDPAETERDMDFARRLNLNQVRVFLNYTAYDRDRTAFRKNLLHFVRACHERGIGVMPVIQYPFGWSGDPASWHLAEEWVADLVKTIGTEPGLAFWDACNEPRQQRLEFAKHMAGVFRKLDSRTPVTVGTTFESEMEALGADAVDVLTFHDYSPTRAEIRANIESARQFAAKAGKPLMNTEIGCVARNNPYDVTLEEYIKGGVGWYIWELMITNQWGTVHGVFYADGTVRDPSIVAALMGFFRNRGPSVIPEVVDREGRATLAVTENEKWLADPNPDWAKGLDLAERSANLLEAGQLIAMHDLPTRQVAFLRRGQPDIATLRALIRKFTGILEENQVPVGDPRRNRIPGWIR